MLGLRRAALPGEWRRQAARATSRRCWRSIETGGICWCSRKCGAPKRLTLQCLRSCRPAGWCQMLPWQRPYHSRPASHSSRVYSDS